MKIVIEKDKIINIDDININSGSIQYYKIYFEFDESWNDLTKKVIIINRKTGQAKELAIIDNYIYLDIFESGDYSIGVVGYTLNEENEKEYQISTNLKTICIRKGAGQFKATINEIPTISEWEIYINQIQELCNGVVIKNIEEEIDGLNHNFTINYTDGTSFKFTIKDGEDGTGGGTGGTSNYNDLTNKPQINGVPLEGNKTSKDLGIKQEYTANDIAFEDGETFQQKYDNGELKGDKGDKGDTGANGQNGENGQDGFSPTVTTTPISNGTKVSITDKTGTKEFDVMNGEQGLQGEPGEVIQQTIVSAIEPEDEKVSVWIDIDDEADYYAETIVFEDGETLQEKYEKGELTGPQGTDGKTPVKGVDYFTEQDKQEFSKQVSDLVNPIYKSVASVTLSEDVAQVTLDLSTTCNDLILLLTIPAMTERPIINIDGIKDAKSSRIASIYTSMISQSTQRSFMIKASPIEATKCYSDTRYGSNTNALDSSRYSIIQSDLINGVDSIKLSVTSSINLLAGTKIEIIGRMIYNENL